MLEKLKNEFSNPENIKDMERGIFFGLIVGTIFAALFTTSDYLALSFDYVRGQNPYGVLWYWLNPNFWTDLPYRLNMMFLVLIMELCMWYFFIHRKDRRFKLSKFLFYAGWLQEIIWMRGTVFQNLTVTLFAPLGSIFPWLVVPWMLFQKLPIGWSWNLSDKHWWCAWVGNSGFTNSDTITFPNGQTLISCPGGWLRWNPAYSWFWSYAMIIFWLIVPTLFWLKPRIKAWRQSRMDDEGKIEGHFYLRPICWVKRHNIYFWGRMFGGQVKFVCSRCGWKWGRVYEVHGECAECSKCGREFCDEDECADE